MGIITLLIIALGLTFDTFAVSISTGLVLKSIRFRQATKIALVLSVFQGLMPLLGWFIGMKVKSLIDNYNHWIAFGLLVTIGIKMIVESQKKDDGEVIFSPLKPLVLIGIAIATSIDAFIVGISFAFINVNIVFSIFIIGFVTYVVAMLGMLFGKNAGNWFGRKMEILGGIILIGIGFKIVIQHYWQIAT
jgi:putative Mn2+ efflux pump MntP